MTDQYKAGFYPDIPNDQYHRSAGYSSSSLKVLTEKTLAHLEYERANPSDYTEAKIKGSVLHTLVLEPEKFDSEYLVKPDSLVKPTKAQIRAKKPSDNTIKQIEDWNEYLDELGDKTEVSLDIYDQAKAMADKVREHPEVKELLSVPYLVEHSVYYWYQKEPWDEDEYKIMCKIRPDLILKGHSCIFDLKSARSASFSNFSRDASNLGYNFSSAMYLEGANTDKAFCDYCDVFSFTDFCWIVVENEPPYEVALYELNQIERDKGLQLYHEAVRRLNVYLRSEWKGYGEFVDGVNKPYSRQLEFKNWKKIV